MPSTVGSPRLGLCEYLYASFLPGQVPAVVHDAGGDRVDAALPGRRSAAAHSCGASSVPQAS